MITNLFISDVLVEGCVDGCFVRNCSNVFISNSVFFRNNARGLVASISARIMVVTNCQAHQNESDGYFAAETSFVFYFDCIAMENGASGWLLEGSDCAFDCIALGNGESGSASGFNVGSFAIVRIERCTSERNFNSGFDVASSPLSSAFGTINQCFAFGNPSDGFKDTFPSFINYVSNNARNNGADYNPSGSGTAPFFNVSSTSSAASYWRNVS